LLVRQLPRADYGAYVTFTAYLSIFIVISSLGLIAVAERYVPELRARASGRALAQFVLRLLAARYVVLLGACALAAFLGTAITTALSMPHLVDAFVIFQVIVVAEAACRYTETIFDSLLQQKYSQLSTLFRYGLRLAALAVYAATASDPLTLMTWVSIEAGCALAGLALATLLVSIVVRRSWREGEAEGTGSGEVGTIHFEYRRYLRYAAPVFLGRLIASLSGLEAAKLVAARLVGLEATAVFGFCASLTIMMQRYLPTFLIMNMVRPLFITASTSDKPQSRLGFLYGLFIKLNFFVLLPIVAVVGAAGDSVVSALSGGKFAQGGGLLGLFVVMLAAHGLRNVHGMVLMALEDGKGSLLVVVLSAVLFAVSIALVPLLGIPVLIVALILADVVSMWVGRARFARRDFRLTFPYPGLGQLLGAAVVAFVAMHVALAGLAGMNESTGLLASAAVAVVAYGAAARLMRAFSQRERDAVNRLLPVKIFVW
jgi:O-antigen/teichoic acid export membrane protein